MLWWGCDCLLYYLMTKLTRGCEISEIRLFLKVALTASLTLAAVFFFSCSDFSEIPYEARLSQNSGETSSTGSEVSSSSETSSSSSEISSSSEASSSSEISSSSEASSSSISSSSSVYSGDKILMEDFQNTMNYNLWGYKNIGDTYSSSIYPAIKHNAGNTYLEFTDYSLVRLSSGNYGGINLTQCIAGFSYSYRGAEHSFVINLYGAQSEENGYFMGFEESPDWVTVYLSLSDLKKNGNEPLEISKLLSITGFIWIIDTYNNPQALAIDDFSCLGI